jgi:aerobic-type carbon monoxide dehydrogenase small subunit (CoxS/CutS family)
VDSDAVLALVSRHGYRRAFVDRVGVSIDINGAVFEREVETRMLLSDFIRHEAGLTGTHVGCEHGVCGACTVQLEGAPVRACLLLAVQAHGRHVRTVEGLAGEDGTLHPLQQAFHETHALQCGFCTPGFLMAIEPMLARTGELDDAHLRELIGGNLCRCTGYDSIVSAVRLAHGRLAQELGPPAPAAPETAAAPDASDGPARRGAPGRVWRRRVPAAVALALALVAGAAVGRRRR